MNDKMTDYTKNETIEVLDANGKWVTGRYMFKSIDEGFHVIECSSLWYGAIKTPDDKIRKVDHG